MREHNPDVRFHKKSIGVTVGEFGSTAMNKLKTVLRQFRGLFKVSRQFGVKERSEL